MAGGRDDAQPDLADARVIAEWMVLAKRIPAPEKWLQGLIDQASCDPMAGYF